MKKIVWLLLIFIFAFSLIACGNSNRQNEEEKASFDIQNGTLETLPEQDGISESEVSLEERHILIAYFTWAENAASDSMDAVTAASVKSPGNVAQLAQWISSETGGNLFSIQVTELYPADWDTCLSRASDEKADGIHPELSNTVEDISEYDTVFLGFPNWWYSCPMAIFSFLEEHDLGGKEVYLFCSHGTGGLAGSVRDITAALPESAIVSKNVFHVYQDDTVSAKEDLQEWLNQISVFSGK